jgi:nucleoid DNA-binding protein
MCGSVAGLEIVIGKVGQALGVSRRAADIVSKVILCMEQALVENLDADGFTIKLNKLDKLTVRHRAPRMCSVPFTGETKLVAATRNVKFVALGRLRKMRKIQSAVAANAADSRPDIDRTR